MSKTKKEISKANLKTVIHIDEELSQDKKEQSGKKETSIWEAILEMREQQRVGAKLLDTACARIKMLEEELRNIQVYLEEDQAIEVSDDEDFIDDNDRFEIIAKKKKSKYNLKENQEDFSQE